MKRLLAWVEKILSVPVVQAVDTLTGNSIAVGKVFYAGKSRLVVVAFEETAENIRIITVHPIRASQYWLRLQSGRWKKK